MTAALEDLSLLRSFVRIVESGSISAAARTFKVPQPTLSRHLRLLEEGCGVVLLRRDTHSMRLTEAGIHFHEDAVGILALMETAAQRLRGGQTELSGHLRLFATIDAGQFAITRLIAQFLREHPGLTADLGYSNRPSRMIEEGFDAAVVAGSITDDRVVARPAGWISRHFYAAPEVVAGRGAPKVPSDLASWPWVGLAGRQFGLPDAILFEGAKGQGCQLEIRPVLTCEGVTSVREALLAGLGVGVLPDWLARESVAAGRLLRILPRWQAPPLAMHVIHPADRKLPARVRAFTDFATDYMLRELSARD